MTRAYRDAGYFARNVRTIEVLVDRDAVASGAAATGQPWQHYDVGHGYCSYTFFEQCPHRLACARCDFYTPKTSSTGQLIEAKDNLQRMLVDIPHTPTMNAPPSLTARPPLSTFSPGWATSRLLPDRRRTRSEARRVGSSCRSSRREQVPHRSWNSVLDAAHLGSHATAVISVRFNDRAVEALGIPVGAVADLAEIDPADLSGRLADGGLARDERGGLFVPGLSFNVADFPDLTYRESQRNSWHLDDHPDVHVAVDEDGQRASATKTRPSCSVTGFGSHGSSANSPGLILSVHQPAALLRPTTPTERSASTSSGHASAGSAMTWTPITKT